MEQRQTKRQNVTLNILDVTQQMHSAQREHGPWIYWYDFLNRYCLQINCWPFLLILCFHSDDETGFNLHSIRLRYGSAPVSRQTPVTHMNTGPTGDTNRLELYYHPFVSSHVWAFFLPAAGHKQRLCNFHCDWVMNDNGLIIWRKLVSLDSFHVLW